MEPNYVNSRIGEKIKDLRNKNGLTQQGTGRPGGTDQRIYIPAGAWPGGTFRGDTAGSD